MLIIYLYISYSYTNILVLEWYNPIPEGHTLFANGITLKTRTVLL
jgi:hypothetical protein